jgi:hypothetical protein
MNTPLEELLHREAAKLDGTATMERMQAFVAAQPNMVHFLQRQGIVPTLPNLKAAAAMSKSRKALAEALAEAGASEETLPNAASAPLSESKPPSRLIAEAWAGLGDPTPRVEAARELLALQNSLNNENGFSVPMTVNGHTSSLHVYVVNDKALHEDGARILLSLDTASLGEVQGYVTLGGGTADVSFIAEKAAAARFLEACKGSLAAALGEAGFETGDITFSAAEKAKTDTPAAPQTAETPPVPDSAHEYRI